MSTAVTRSPRVSSEPDGLPRISVSQVSTLAAGFADDVRTYAAAGLDGIGIWEMKLGDGPDDEAVALLRESGLSSATAVPAGPSILPLPLLAGPDEPRGRVDSILRSLHPVPPLRAAAPPVPSTLPLPLLAGPDEPRERVDSILRSLHRLAPFEPAAVLCITGPGGRAAALRGLREVVAEAERLGLRIALEPFQSEGLENWSIASTLGDAAAVVEEIGSAPLRLP